MKHDEASQEGGLPVNPTIPGTYAFTTLPLRRQEAHTRIFLLLAWPATLARTGRRLMFQRRLVMLCAWLTLLPERGDLPQT